MQCILDSSQPCLFGVRCVQPGPLHLQMMELTCCKKFEASMRWKGLPLVPADAQPAMPCLQNMAVIAIGDFKDTDAVVDCIQRHLSNCASRSSEPAPAVPM